MNIRILYFLGPLIVLLSCSSPPKDIAEVDQVRICQCDPATEARHKGVRGALLASRIKDLEQLKGMVEIKYFAEGSAAQDGPGSTPAVQLKHCSSGKEVISILEMGVDEKDFKKARAGGFWEQVQVGWSSPYAVKVRQDLYRVFILSRRRPNLFGEGDPAFLDLAETSVAHINTPDLAYNFPKDTMEKGYLNSFNHITAQAFMTSLFSEKMADFVADVHERYNMPELITGVFTAEQLVDPNKNPMDNYVDMINNEWGQELGKQLRDKYQLGRYTPWTAELLANYLNDLQGYYTWAFQIGLQPYRPQDEVVIRFAEKLNIVMADGYR